MAAMQGRADGRLNWEPWPISLSRSRGAWWRPGTGMGAIACLLLLSVCPLDAQTTNIEETVIFTTGFENSEGYNPTLTLAGQNGWQSLSISGNGLVNDFFADMGQQAFVGYAFSDAQDTNGAVNVWRPVVTVPTTNLYPRLRFTVAMSIIDSTTTNAQYDDFRWSAYNAQAHRFFTVDFDNVTRLISYALDDSVGFRSTGILFSNQVMYNLTIDLDLARNTWSAAIDHGTLVINQPITTTNAELNLSDIDAVWVMTDPVNPGDNYMLFDDYRITAQTAIELKSRPPDGQLVWRLHGRPNRTYVIDATTDSREWTPYTTNTTSADGFFEFADATVASRTWKLHLYRARFSP